MRETVGVLFQLLIGLTATAQAQTGTLTLACEGTLTGLPGHGPGRIEASVIFDFGAGTVTGFGIPGMITSSDNMTIEFRGSKHLSVPASDAHPVALESDASNVGALDRVTGHLDVTETAKTSTRTVLLTYSLQCRPA